MATTILPMTGRHLLSFLFVGIMMMTSSCYCQSVHAFTCQARRHHYLLLNNNGRRRSTSQSDIISVAYTSTPFDIVSNNNNDDPLWQLLQNLRHERNNSNSNAQNCNNNNNNDDSYSEEEEAAFQRVIQSLYHESQVNIHNLEKEIDVLRQTLEASPNNSCHQSFQTMIQEDNHSNNNIINNSSRSSSSSSSSRNMDVDEISNKILKAVFVGYKWTEDDKKRLSSAHPQDYHV